jgi:hypothetical protein
VEECAPNFRSLITCSSDQSLLHPVGEIPELFEHLHSHNMNPIQEQALKNRSSFLEHRSQGSQ